MENRLSALIVDDEENALTLLNKLLEDTKQFSEVRSASSPVVDSKSWSHTWSELQREVS